MSLRTYTTRRSSGMRLLAGFLLAASVMVVVPASPAVGGAGDVVTSYGNNDGIATLTDLDFGGYTLSPYTLESGGMQSDDKLLMHSGPAVGRLTANGAVDTSFGTTASGVTVMELPSVNPNLKANWTPKTVAQDTLIQDDGKIVVVGYQCSCVSPGYAADIALWRLNTNGSVDTSYGTDGYTVTHIFTKDMVVDGALQPDGKVVVLSGHDTTSYNSAFVISRFNTDGSLDTSFGGGNGYVEYTGKNGATSDLDYPNKILVRPDGKILAFGGGWSNAYSGDNNFGIIVSMNSDGTLDTSWGEGGYLYTNWALHGDNPRQFFSAALQPDGKVVAVGKAWGYQGGQHATVVRLNTDGTRDTTFNPDSYCDEFCHQIVVGPGVVRVVENLPISGSDDALDTYGLNEANDVVIQADGKILVAGDGPAGITLVRLDTNGYLDSTFGPTSDGRSASVSLDGVDTIYGEFVYLRSDGNILLYDWSRDWAISLDGSGSGGGGGGGGGTPAGVTLSGTTATVSETGTTGTFTVVLDA